MTCACLMKNHIGGSHSTNDKEIMRVMGNRWKNKGKDVVQYYRGVRKLNLMYLKWLDQAGSRSVIVDSQKGKNHAFETISWKFWFLEHEHTYIEPFLELHYEHVEFKGIRLPSAYSTNGSSTWGSMHDPECNTSTT